MNRMGYPSIPLIINTQGWIAGIGQQLLYSIIEYAKPHRIVQIVAGREDPLDFSRYADSNKSNNNNNNSNNNKNSKSNNNRYLPEIYIFPSSTTVTGSPDRIPIQFSPAERRNLQLMHYFEESLMDKLPYTLQWDSHIRVRITNEQVPFSHILYVLNASIVGLVADPNPCRY